MIHSLTARAVELPLERPIETAAGTIASSPLVLIDVRADDGLVGRSYLRTYTPLALRALAALLDDLAPEIEGKPAEPGAVGSALASHFGLLGTRGLVGAAFAGIDMALWDLEARRAGNSLAAHLGASATSVRAYRPLRSMSAERACEEAAEAVAAGFDAIKVKLGRGEIRQDVELVRALRDAIGPHTILMADYNQTLTVDEAIRRGQALDDAELAWIEEPTDAHDLAGNRRIAGAIQTPLAIGENQEGPAEIAALIDSRAARHLTFDVMRIGGVSGWREAAGLAAAAGLPISSHAFAEFSAHLLAASATCHLLEHADHLGPINLTPPQIQDGSAIVSGVAGAGLEWDEQVIAVLTR